MSRGTERLRTLRRAYGRRGEARGGNDVAYLVYVVVLLTVIVVFPLVRAMVVGLAQPAVIAALDGPRAGLVVGAGCAVLAAGLVWWGQLRGPVTPAPFFVTLLATTDLPRRLTLRRSFWTSALLVVAVSTGIGTLLAGTLLAAGAAPLPDAAAFVLACACSGLVGSVVWLAGQRFGSRPRSVAAVALLAGAVLAWAGLLWPTGPVPPVWPLLGLTLATLAALRCVPGLLDALDGPRLRDDAERWQSASTAAISGDVAHALGSFRARPAVGRTWHAVAGDGVVPRFLRRDLVAALRTPGRFTVAVLALIAASVVVSLWPAVDAPLGWLPAAAGSVIGYLALGVLSDGFRHAAEAGAAPPLYGYRAAHLYLLHGLLPAAIAALAAAAGAGIAVAAGAPFATAITGALVLPVLVVVRAYDSARGSLPIALLAPVPTPAGDASAVIVLAWQADALLIAGVVGAVTATMADAGQGPGALGVLLAVAATLVLMLRRRLHDR